MTRASFCRECGGAFTPNRMTQSFCRAACRKTFNNRRAERGAELYDLVMLMRFDREEAKAVSAFSLLCAKAGVYRQADKVERQGRPSWDKQARTRDGHSARGRERSLRTGAGSAASASHSPRTIPDAATRRSDREARP